MGCGSWETVAWDKKQEAALLRICHSLSSIVPECQLCPPPPHVLQGMACHSGCGSFQEFPLGGTEACNIVQLVAGHVEQKLRTWLFFAIALSNKFVTVGSVTLCSVLVCIPISGFDRQLVIPVRYVSIVTSSQLP